jgi:hypothetical protein
LNVHYDPRERGKGVEFPHVNRNRLLSRRTESNKYKDRRDTREQLRQQTTDRQQTTYDRNQTVDFGKQNTESVGQLRPQGEPGWWGWGQTFGLELSPT